MSTFDTELDEINHICSLVGEILELGLDVFQQTTNEKILTDINLISSKASTIKNKAQRMENRLREYRVAIEGLGFKRVKDRKKKK